MHIKQDEEKAVEVARDLSIVEKLVKAIDEVFLNVPEGSDENRLLAMAIIVGNYDPRPFLD